MKTWLGRMPWAVGWLFFIATVAGGPPSVDQIQLWVSQLDADDFAVREVAGRNLVAAGEAAIEALTAGVVGGSPEAVWRASGILEQIALGGDEATLKRVAAALQQISKQGKSDLVGIIKEVYSKQSRIRQERAVAKIRALGGKFDGDEPAEAFPIQLNIQQPGGIAAINFALKGVEALLNGPQPAAEAPLPDPPPDLPPDQILPRAEAPLPVIADVFIADAFAPPLDPDARATNEPQISLTIDEDWRGGDSGLAALRDLPQIRSLSLRRAPLTDAALEQIAALSQLQSLDIEGTPISGQSLSIVRQKRPELRVFARGNAMLGVSADVSGPCVVTAVFTGSGAAEAGIQAGDEIHSVAGNKVCSFSDLTIAVYTHQPGDKVEIEFRRGGMEQKMEVLLKERKVVEAAGR